jgi:hypothetical protein
MARIPLSSNVANHQGDTAAGLIAVPPAEPVLTVPGSMAGKASPSAAAVDVAVDEPRG